MKSFKIFRPKTFFPFLKFLSHSLADYHSHLYFTVIKHHVMAQAKEGMRLWLACWRIYKYFLHKPMRVIDSQQSQKGFIAT